MNRQSTSYIAFFSRSHGIFLFLNRESFAMNFSKCFNVPSMAYAKSIQVAFLCIDRCSFGSRMSETGCPFIIAPVNMIMKPCNELSFARLFGIDCFHMFLQSFADIVADRV